MVGGIQAEQQNAEATVEFRQAQEPIEVTLLEKQHTS